jgi:FkbM family methyltransferase
MNHPMTAALRHLRHRLAGHKWARLLAGQLNIRTIHHYRYLGHNFFVPGDSLIANRISGGGEWDRIVRSIVDVVVQGPQPIVCEVGTNVGASLMQIFQARPNARVTAFEPSRRYRSILLRNVAAAGRTDVTIESTFLGAAPGSVWLYNNESSASAVSATYDGHEARGRQRVSVTTLDAAYRGPRPLDFLKIDTDGYDFDVLRGAKRLLEEDKPLLLFEFAPHLCRTPAEQGLAFLMRLGYRRFVCFSPFGTLRGTAETVEGVCSFVDPHIKYCDVLVACEGSIVFERLTAAIASGALANIDV